MTNTKIYFIPVLLFGLISIQLSDPILAQSVESKQARAKAQADMKNGNFKDALAVFQKLCTSEDTDATKVSSDLANAVNCLNRLGNQKQFDELIEKSISAHSSNWRLLQTAAKQYMSTMHYGYEISGKYERGPHRGGGKLINSQERDRVRALQLMTAALPKVLDEDKKTIAGFYTDLASQLFYYRGYNESWRLQAKTDLSILPDYDDGYPYNRGGKGAPVGDDGKPVYYSIASDWGNAFNDGERWRFCLEQIELNDPSQRNNIRNQLANFSRNQFGVPTMRNDMYWPAMIRNSESKSNKEDESGTYALHTLSNDETIAKLATGIKRFELPDDYNFIKIWEDIVENPATGSAEVALQQLAQVYEDRRQYVKAAQVWRQNIESFGAGRNAWKTKRLQQIVKNWGRFESTTASVAGKGANLDYRFRNGKTVSLTAEKINIELLADDAIEHINSKPQRIDWNKIAITNIGYRLINGDGAKYLGKQVASWKKKLDPKKGHYDSRVTIKTPFSEPGAYLVTAKMDDGNTSKIIVWLSDMVIIRKPLSEKSLYFVADAVSGAPVANATLKFFGYKQTYQNKTVNGRRTSTRKIETREFVQKADANGQVIVPQSKLENGYQWLVRGSTKTGRRAYDGFRNLWHNKIYDPEYNATRTLVVTDRPVYRPGNKMQFKIWTRHAQYDKEFVSQFANKSITYEIRNPKGESVLKKSLMADEFGGISAEFTIPTDAMLGQYFIQCSNGSVGGNRFRVEEYKKPEFEVKIEAPTDPIKLGEKIAAKVEAKYYFGAPVTNATVKYTITRQEYNNTWFPEADWDWCYGPGYWWFGYDTPWFKGFGRWCGCFRPFPWWGPKYQAPPEVIAQREVKIGEDGTVEIEIDTALAKEIHGDQSQKYSITAEVRDSSRRTIVGSGSVLVAQQPFKVFTWLDRGFFKTGDVIKANFQAQTLDQKPVQGLGQLSLLKITYDADQKPVETEVGSWKVDTDEAGFASHQIKPNQAGQYRLSYELTDSEKNKIEGGYVFTVIGKSFASEKYRFNNLELIPEKREYRAGETVKLQLNTNRKDGTVLIFTRPSSGVYLPPTLLKLDGKSTVIEIDVTKKDMPNFYVEAVTVANGNVFRETKEIVVPPEKRILNVAVSPSSETYRPGQKAKVMVHVTDHTGENFAGDLAVSIYDKSVEYISGGSNVPDIKTFFWKWRRQHQPSETHTLQKYFGNMIPRGQTNMGNLGIFGENVVEEVETGRDGKVNSAMQLGAKAEGFSRGGGGFGGGGGNARRMAAPGNRMEKSMEMADAAADSPAAAGFAPGGGAADSGTGGDLIQPTVRSNFADTALWVGNLKTNANGIAEVELEMPENLTTWKINVWGMGHGTRVGSGTAEVITRKDLLVRLQAPRFFVQKDLVTLSAVVNNYLPTNKDVKVSLELVGNQIVCIDSPTTTVKVKANGEARVDWKCRVNQPGEVTVRMLALSDAESDAMEMKFPVKVHGFLKMESFAGTVRPGEKSSLVNVVVPADRQVDKTQLEIRYTPTLAMAMIDALPYLNDYPHGCTEQTLNRWLPSLMTQKVLIEMGIDLEDIAKKKTNLNAQEIGDDRLRATQWKEKGVDAVWSKAEVSDMVQAGLERLAAMQVSDGGWGWFSGLGERSYPHTTAVVVHGLQIARDNDAEMDLGLLKRGIQWLVNYQKQQVQLIKNYAMDVRPSKSAAGNLDAFIYMILTEEKIDNVEMRDFLYRDRNELSVYAKAVFGLALETVGDDEKLQMVMKNIDQYVVQDAENETAYIKNPTQNYWYFWYGSEIEANAYYLKLLSRTKPKGKTAPRLVKYLLNNRKHATYWKSTRDTALCIEAFAEYINSTGENKPEMTVEILVDGKLKKEVQISAQNLFTFDNKFQMSGNSLSDGKHQIEIRRKGDGPVYWNTYLTNFSTEDYITKAGLEVKIERKFFKLLPIDKEIDVTGSRGQVVGQKVEKFDRTELTDLATLKSGDLVEVELSVVSKNDYEYLQFEDFKPAGFEAVNVQSGYAKSGMRAYVEYRDDRVNFFVQRLARGNHSVKYRLRAETPGRFSALPARVAAMYAPELKGNSDEIKLNVED